MRVIALIPYPIDKGPSQRFRLGVYLPYLNQFDVSIDCHPFYRDEGWKVLYSEGRIIKKVEIVLLGFLRRVFLLFKLSKYDVVYVQREITPIGPPVIAWLITKIFKKKMVYDFDDAVWMANYSSSNAMFHKLKAYWKTKFLIKWSSTVVAGNGFLAEYAVQFNTNVSIIPTVVDTRKVHNPNIFKRNENTVPVIGWTGSLSTLHHLDIIFPVLDELYKSFKFEFLVISNKPPKIQRDYLAFKKWNRDSEIEDLMTIDLGIMPLKEDFKFAKGKCGFKLIQYMALKKPVLASPVGINSEIIQGNGDGVLCASEKDWLVHLAQFLKGELKWNTSLSRRKIENLYSVDSTIEQFVKVLKS